MEYHWKNHKTCLTCGSTCVSNKAKAFYSVIFEHLLHKINIKESNVTAHALECKKQVQFFKFVLFNRSVIVAQSVAYMHAVDVFEYHLQADLKQLRFATGAMRNCFIFRNRDFLL